MKGVSAFPSENSAGIDLFTYMVAHAPPRPHEAIFSPKPECQCEPEPPAGCAPCVQALMQFGENSEQFQQRAVDQKELAKKYVAQVMAIRDANVAALAVWSAQQSAQWAVTWASAVKMAMTDKIVVTDPIPADLAEKIRSEQVEEFEKTMDSLSTEFHASYDNRKEVEEVEQAVSQAISTDEPKAPEPEPLVPSEDA